MGEGLFIINRLKKWRKKREGWRMLMNKLRREVFRGNMIKGEGWEWRRGLEEVIYNSEEDEIEGKVKISKKKIKKVERIKKLMRV